MVSNVSGAMYDPQLMIDKLKTTFLDNFIKSYDKNDSKKFDKEIKSLLDAADKDNSGSLSKAELSSLKATDDSEQSKEVRNLIKNFDDYDENKDGELSVTELKGALKKFRKQFSQQDIAKMAREMEEFNNSQNPLQITAGNLSNSLMKKLISNYKIDSSSVLESFLSIEA